MKKGIALIASCLICFGSVSAQEVNGLIYNTVGIGYGKSSIDGSVDGVSIDGDLGGVGFAAQGVLAERVVLGMGYQQASGDVRLSAFGRSLSVDTDISQASFFAGVRVGVANGFDLLPFVQHISSTTEIEGEKDDNDDTVIGIRLNSRLSDVLQGTFGFRTDGKDDEFGKTFDLGVLIRLQKNIGLGASYSLNDSDSGDTKGWSLSINYLF